LPAAVQASWTSIVESLPPNHFHRSDATLLTLYCRSLYQATVAFENIEEQGAFHGSSQNPAARGGCQREASGDVSAAPAPLSERAAGSDRGGHARTPGRIRAAAVVFDPAYRTSDADAV